MRLRKRVSGNRSPRARARAARNFSGLRGSNALVFLFIAGTEVARAPPCFPSAFPAALGARVDAPLKGHARLRDAARDQRRRKARRMYLYIRKSRTHETRKIRVVVNFSARTLPLLFRSLPFVSFFDRTRTMRALAVVERRCCEDFEVSRD